jgi:NADP-dependent 3-hydroxy acid dehydrogenase YdfG
VDRGRALVVGGSSAIGAAIAAELAGLDYRLSLWGRDEDRLGAAAAGCGPAGAHCVRVDVTDRTALASAAHEVSALGPLTAVVWAAGLFDWAPADRADVTAWDALLDVNLASAAVATRLLLPALLDAAPSALVYLGSGASHQGFANNAAYIASKHGIAGLADGVFLDVRDRGVKVALISPGLVAAGAGLDSPAARHPERLLQPADVAAAVRFVVTSSPTACPTQVRLQPQFTT